MQMYVSQGSIGAKRPHIVNAILEFFIVRTPACTAIPTIFVKESDKHSLHYSKLCPVSSFPDSFPQNGVWACD